MDVDRRHVDRKRKWMHDDTSTAEANMAKCMAQMIPKKRLIKKTVLCFD